MSEWKVRMTAVIDDEIVVEADTDGEAVENASQDWTFVEASQWRTVSVERVGGEDDDDAVE